MLLVGVTYFGKAMPDDTVRVMTIGGKFNQVCRHAIGAKATNQGISLKGSSLPRSVSFQSNGARIRVYLLDLIPVQGSLEKVKAYMAASEEIAQGQVPATSTLVNRAEDVTEGVFQLSRIPWNWNADYMLIVYSQEETQVIVRVSYTH